MNSFCIRTKKSCLSFRGLWAICILLVVPLACAQQATGDTAEGVAPAWSSSSVESSSELPSALPESPSAIKPAVKLSGEEKAAAEAKRNSACENGELQGKPCRVSWIRVLGQSFIFLSAQHLGNIVMDTDTRYALTHGTFWGDYVYCVEHYRWSRWKDDDPFGVDYIGHPMMGAMTNSIYEQNDPKQRALAFENTRRYWTGRLRATAYSAAYSAQWKVGPLSEASVGNTGIGYYIRPRDGVYTNETGMQDFFITPIGGLVWNVGEDVIERYLFRHVRSAHPNNKSLLAVASLMTPMRSVATMLGRGKAPYYRDQDLQTYRPLSAR